MQLVSFDSAGSPWTAAPICASAADQGSTRMVSVPEIALHGVSKRYSTGAVALEGISFNVERGEFVTLLGPSGCGKSTLLRLVSGLSVATDGSIRVNGMTPENARELMSFIFQDPTLM